MPTIWFGPKSSAMPDFVPDSLHMVILIPKIIYSRKVSDLLFLQKSDWLRWNNPTVSCGQLRPSVGLAHTLVSCSSVARQFTTDQGVSALVA